MKNIIVIRFVRADDIRFVFDLANDAIVRETAFTPQKITWETHCAWFEKQQKSNNPFYIVEQLGEPCGYIRFQLHEGSDSQWLLTIAINPENRGKGIGQVAVTEACKKVLARYNVQKIIARVQHGNFASARLFLSSGFIEDSNQNYREFYYSK